MSNVRKLLEKMLAQERIKDGKKLARVNDQVYRTSNVQLIENYQILVTSLENSTKDGTLETKLSQITTVLSGESQSSIESKATVDEKKVEKSSKKNSKVTYPEPGKTILNYGQYFNLREQGQSEKNILEVYTLQTSKSMSGFRSGYVRAKNKEAKAKSSTTTVQPSQ